MKAKAFSALALGLMLTSLLTLSACGQSGDVDGPGMLYFYATW